MKATVTGTGVLAIGGIGIAAYLLYRYRPIPAIAEAVDNAIAAAENSANNVGNDMWGWLSPILGTHSPIAPVTGSAADQRLYEINLGKDSLKDMFTGSKPFYKTKHMDTTGFPFPRGTILQRGPAAPISNYLRNTSAVLIPKGYTLIGRSGSTKENIGDPRALYCLDLLMAISGLSSAKLHTTPASLENEKISSAGTGGYCIDVYDDAVMNRLIEAAKKAAMPIGWISKYPTLSAAGTNIFKNYVLSAGVKRELGSSPIAHADAWHVYLPRPQAALGYFAGSPWQSETYKPYFAPVSDGFIPDGPPPINSN